jgi:hypothetical protein
MCRIKILSFFFIIDHRLFIENPKVILNINKEIKMSASNFIILKSLNTNQYFRFVAQYLNLTGFTDIEQILRKTKIGIDFIATKNNLKYIVRVYNEKQKIEENLLNEISSMLPLYKANRIVLFSLMEFNDEFRSQAINRGIEILSKNEIEIFLNNRFTSCLEFLDYLHNHKIRIYLKYTTQELIDEYFRLKKELKKGYISGNDVNLYSKCNWTLYKIRFGTWKNFLEEINEDTERFKEITAEDLKLEYQKIKNDLKKNTITLQDMEDNSHYSEHPIKRLFGSWNNFVYEMEGYHSNSAYSDNEIITEYYRVKKIITKRRYFLFRNE